VIFTVVFLDGPCARTTKKIEMGAHPDPTLVCRGSTYVFRGSQGAQPGTATLGPLYYALSGGRLDRSQPQIEGETDVFRAWGRLHVALNRTVGQQSRRVSNAGRRIRRAVK
jgi:hypothetical protein